MLSSRRGMGGRNAITVLSLSQHRVVQEKQKKNILVLPIYLIYCLHLHLLPNLIVRATAPPMNPSGQLPRTILPTFLLPTCPGMMLQFHQGSAQPSSLSTSASLWSSASSAMVFFQNKLPSTCGVTWQLEESEWACSSVSRPLIHYLALLNILRGKGWVCSENHWFQDPPCNQMRSDSTSVPSALSSSSSSCGVTSQHI